MSRRSSFSGDDDGWGRKKKSDEIDLDITPMIDVTFLLLIFFMVASTMQAAPDMDVPASKHGQGIDQKFAFTIFVTAGESRGDPPVIRDAKANPMTMQELITKATSEFEAGKTKLVIRSDGRVAEGYLHDIMKEIGKIPDVSFAVGVRDKRY